MPEDRIGKLVDALSRCLWLLEAPGVAEAKPLRGYQVDYVIDLAKKALNKNIFVCPLCGGNCEQLMKAMAEVLRKQKTKKAIQDLRTKPKVRRR